MNPGIPRGTSFTNLIEDSYNDYMSGSSHISDEDSVPQAQTFSQMSPPQVESTNKKSQRGINFSIEEDILLVSAFLNVNQDVVKSNNQKRCTYWMRIWEYYHKWKTFTSEHTAEDDDALQVPIVNLERPPGVKAEKERLKKQKCKEGTTSHIEDVLNVMMEEKRKMNEMKMAYIEKGRIADHEQEMARILLEDKKLETEKMKIELVMKNLIEANVMEKMRLDKLKEDNEMEKIRMKQVKEETEIMMMDVSMLSSVQQEYIHQRQMEILEK
nr:hypothetical protein CFP56_23010 [Quercus suber]